MIMKRNGAEISNKRSNTGHIALLLLLGCGLTALFAFLLSMLYQYKGDSLPTATEAIRQDFSIVESEGGVYWGELFGTDYSGEGQFQHLSEGIYTGRYADSMREGEGKFIWSNGDSFDGSWIADQMHEGTYTFANGHTYTGSFENNKFEDGNYSLGPDCEMQGFLSFSAEYSNGVLDKINFKTKDGLTYSGAVSGEAKITYPSGNTYVGNVVNGQRFGNGIFTWYRNGSKIASYSGIWMNGQMNGSGKYYYTSNNYPYLSGSFTAGKPDGAATYYKESGNAFITTWSNGKCTKAVED